MVAASLVALLACVSAKNVLFDRKNIGTFLNEDAVSFQGNNALKTETNRLAGNGTEPSPFQFFEQPVDHFDLRNKDSYEQMYVVEDGYYREGGPVFLYLTGEWSLSNTFERSLEGALARKYGGMYVGLEHRYYGEGTSIPVKDFSTKNLKWLTAEQAIADAARFIKDSPVAKRLPKGTKWVAVGGSYAANVATWLRQQHPDLVFAAHASSGPVKAKTDFWRYAYAVDQGIPKSGGTQQCADGWVKAVAAFDKAAIRNPKKLKDLVGAPHNVTINDIAGVTGVLAGDIQYGAGRGGRLDSVVNVNGTTELNVSYMDAVCSGKYFPAFTNPKATEEEALDAIVNFARTLVPTPEEWLEWTLDATADYPPSAKLWTYQFCQDYGYYQIHSYTKRSAYSRFITVKYYRDYCEAVLGKGHRFPNTIAVNLRYKGIHFGKTIDRVVTTHGSVDPWHWLGANADTGIKSTAANPIIMIDGAHHCADLSIPRNTSSPALIKAHDDILNLWGKILEVEAI